MGRLQLKVYDMGADVYGHIGYGFLIFEEDGYHDPMYDIIDELSELELHYSDERWVNETYVIEKYVLEEILYDSIEGVTTINFGSSDYSSIALVVSESVQSSDSWSASPLTLPKYRYYWDMQLKLACDKVGLTYKEPEWLFGAFYSH